MGWFKIHGAAIAAVALLSAGVAAADTFRWITYKPEGAGDAQTRSTKWFVEEFAKRTGGKHRIQVFWGGSVAKTGEVPNALGAGLGDFGDVVTPYFPDRFPLNNAVGFFIPQPHGILKIAELLEGWHKTHPQFEQELSRAKLKVVGWRPLEEYGLLCNKPVRGVAELKGLRIRSYGFAYPRLISAIGATPVSMKTEDTYEALERKILDCTPIGISLARGWKYDEVAKYYIRYPFGASFGHLVSMNLATYNKLDGPTRAVVDAIGREYVSVYNRMVEEDIEAVMAHWKKTGVEVIDFDYGDIKALMANPGIVAVRKTWADKARSLGVDPEPILQQLRF